MPTVSSNDAISFWGRLRDPDTEAAYRNWQSKDEVRRALYIVVAGLLGTLYYIPSDYHFFGNSTLFHGLLALRLLVCAACIALLFYLRHEPAAPDFDRLLLIWAIVFNFSTIYITSTRPAGYTGYAVVNVLCVLLTYCVLPLPFYLQIIPAFLLTFGTIGLGLTTNPWSSEPAGLAIIGELITANVLGPALSRELNRWKRGQFLALSRETELRKNLEHAMSEIKTLRGILPICTHCKRVWNDAGFWEQVEVYVRDHTHAEFSHGLCPTCARQHYPEIDWDKKGL